MSAIAIAALSMLVMFSFITGMKNNLADNLQTYSTGEIRIRHKEFDKYEHLHPLHLRIQDYPSVVRQIYGIEGLQVAVPRVTSPGQVYVDDERYFVSGLAVDIPAERRYQDIDSTIIQGRLPEMGENEAAVGMALAEQTGLAPGDPFTVLTQTMHRGTNAVTLKITGIVNFPIDALNTSTFYVPLDTMQHILQMNDSVTEILVKTSGKYPLREIAEKIESRVQADTPLIEARPWTEIPTSYQFMDMAAAIYNFMAFFFFILGSTVIITTTMMVVYERMKEIGTIAALGMTGGEIVRLFFLESLFLAIIGSAAGVFLGSLITIPMTIAGINFGSVLEGVSIEVSNIVYPDFGVQTILYIFVFSVIVASAASLLPSRKAAKIEPVQALRID